MTSGNLPCRPMAGLQQWALGPCRAGAPKAER
jgi:hypothetical protein